MQLLPLFPQWETLFFNVMRTPVHETPTRVWDLLRAVAQETYDDELRAPFLDLYFRHPVKALLRGTTVLDIGSSVGGRSVRLAKALGLRLIGIDIVPQDNTVALEFARAKGVHFGPLTARAEALPFRDASFENIVTYDGLEHVADLGAVLKECRRVLVPGGHLIAVFPPFFNPLESHLVVSALPCLHWLFSGPVLTRAQYEIARRRGWPPDLIPSTLEPWERMPTLNGVTCASFGQLVNEQGWEIKYRRYAPLFTTGRRARELLVFRLLRLVGKVLGVLPLLRELVTDRLVYVLRNPAV